MDKKIECGKNIAEHVNIEGSEFTDVNLKAAKFDNVNMTGTSFNNINMSGVKLHDINLSDIEVSAVQMGGAKFKHVGLPPCSSNPPGKQRPVTFTEMDLYGSTFTMVDLTNVKIESCKTEGMTIDGVAVSDMLAAYKAKNT
jgi:uncharacterized protein YjbI with pentapeptide repeats